MSSDYLEGQDDDEGTPAEKMKTLCSLAKVDVRSLPVDDVVLYGLDGAEIRAEPSSLLPSKDKLYRVFLRYGSYRVGWILDAEIKNCLVCNVKFNFFIRRHHCRNCGMIICDKCSSHRAIILQLKSCKLAAFQSNEYRVCNLCAAKHRLNEVWDIDANSHTKVAYSESTACAIDSKKECSRNGAMSSEPAEDGDDRSDGVIAMTAPTTADTTATPQTDEEGDLFIVAPTPLNLIDAMDSETSPVSTGLSFTRKVSPDCTPIRVASENQTPIPDAISPLSDVTDTYEKRTECSDSDVTRTPGSAARRRSSWQVMAEMANQPFDSRENTPSPHPHTHTATATATAEDMSSSSSSSGSTGEGRKGQLELGAAEVSKGPARRGSWLQVLGLEAVAAAQTATATGITNGSEIDETGSSSSCSEGGNGSDSASGSSIGDSDMKKYIRRTRREVSGSRDYDDSASSLSSRSLSIDQFVSPFGGQRISSTNGSPRPYAHAVQFGERLDNTAEARKPAHPSSTVPASPVDSKPLPPPVVRKGSLKWFFGLGGDNPPLPSRRSSDPGVPTAETAELVSDSPDPNSAGHRKREPLNGVSGVPVIATAATDDSAVGETTPDGPVHAVRNPSLAAVFALEEDIPAGGAIAGGGE